MYALDERRAAMVANDLAPRGIQDAAVLRAMGTVPREAFLPVELAAVAYEDGALPIGEGQTISQPFIVALMTQALELSPTDRVLEIGTGSGYAAAILAEIAEHVYTVERYASLAEAAEARFAEMGYDNVKVRVGDGSEGWPEHAPYDAIVVAAGAPTVPQALRDQLAVGGRLVIPVGPTQRSQSLVRERRLSETELSHENLGEVRFVPLVGEHAWPDEGLVDRLRARLRT